MPSFCKQIVLTSNLRRLRHSVMLRKTLWNESLSRLSRYRTIQAPTLRLQIGTRGKMFSYEVYPTIKNRRWGRMLDSLGSSSSSTNRSTSEQSDRSYQIHSYSIRRPITNIINRVFVFNFLPFFSHKTSTCIIHFDTMAEAYRFVRKAHMTEPGGEIASGHVRAHVLH